MTLRFVCVHVLSVLIFSKYVNFLFVNLNFNFICETFGFLQIYLIVE